MFLFSQNISFLASTLVIFVERFHPVKKVPKYIPGFHPDFFQIWSRNLLWQHAAPSLPHTALAHVTKIWHLPLAIDPAFFRIPKAIFF